MATILSSPFVVEYILPFLLVFVVMFAILQKTKIFGDGKRQIDALVSLAIGLIVIAFGYATNIITKLMPVLAITAVVILIFMILYGMTFKESEFAMNNWLKGGIGVVVGIVIVVSVLVITGAWDYLIEYYETSDQYSLIGNIGFIVLIVIVVALVLYSGKGKDTEKKP